MEHNTEHFSFNTMHDRAPPRQGSFLYSPKGRLFTLKSPIQSSNWLVLEMCSDAHHHPTSPRARATMDGSSYGAEPTTPMSLTANGVSSTSSMRRPLLALLTGGLCFAGIASVHELGTGASGGPMTDEAVDENSRVSLAAKLKRPNVRAEYEHANAQSPQDASHLSKSWEKGSQTRPVKKAKAEAKGFFEAGSSAGSKTYKEQRFGFVADSDYSRRDGMAAGAQYNFGKFVSNTP